MLLPSPKKQPGLGNRLWMALWSKTPSDFRRMSLLSSLYARFASCHEDEQARLTQVNEAFHLTRNVQSMRFSVLIAPYIWSHVLPVSRIDGERLDVYITRILRNTPCWLKYGDDDLIREDIDHLMRYCLNEQCPLPAH